MLTGSDQTAAVPRLVDMAPRAFSLGAADVRSAEMSRLSRCGISTICVSVAGAGSSVQDAILAIARERRSVRGGPGITETSDTVGRAGADGAPGIVLSFGGMEPVGPNLDLVDAYACLGVRVMRLSAGTQNAAMSGSDDPGGGLTTAGRELVQRLNRAGMLIDLSGAGAGAAREVIEASDAPVIFSCGPQHGGNLPRQGPAAELARACADREGVIGVGVPGAGGTDDLFARIDALVYLVGPDHVGIGLGTSDGVDAGDLAVRMRSAGYSDAAVDGIMGGNWKRAIGEVWR